MFTRRLVVATRRRLTRRRARADGVWRRRMVGRRAPRAPSRSWRPSTRWRGSRSRSAASTWLCTPSPSRAPSPTTSSCTPATSPTSSTPTWSSTWPASSPRSTRPSARSTATTRFDVADAADLDLRSPRSRRREHRRGGSRPALLARPDPAGRVAAALADRLGRARPDHAADVHAPTRRTCRRSSPPSTPSFETGLADCASRELVTSHNAFGYLARRYGLTQVGITGLTPEDEPSPADLAAVTDFVRDHDVRDHLLRDARQPGHRRDRRRRDRRRRPPCSTRSRA